MTQLLGIETLLKGGIGLLLIVVPQTLIRILGLPAGGSSLWPRLLGVSCLGIAAGAHLDAIMPGSRGVGLAALTAINLLTAAALGAFATFDASVATRRGRAALVLAATALFGLSLLEIGYA